LPDTLLPVQFFDRSRAADSPEKRLIFAVLLDAILELLRGDAKIAVDAERWIRDEVEDVPISFAAACEALGVEAENLARDLLSRRHVAPLSRMRRRGVRSLKELGRSPRRARQA
jgi:hypothetical protein